MKAGQGRGHYDRLLTREQRAASERQAIERAVAELLTTVAAPTIGVKDLSERAGVGRNTLYQHFGGVAPAVAHVLRETRRRLVLAIMERRQDARAPRARCNAIAEAWLEFSRVDPTHALALLIGTPGLEGGLEELLAGELGAVALEAQASGLIGKLPSRDALTAVVAAFCHLGERVASGKARAPLFELVDFLTELALQAFRSKNS